MSNDSSFKKWLWPLQLSTGRQLWTTQLRTLCGSSQYLCTSSSQSIVSLSLSVFLSVFLSVSLSVCLFVCLSSDSKERASQLYEVLSAGGVNALRFPTPGGNGRFEFGVSLSSSLSLSLYLSLSLTVCVLQVRVVDPSFSHCNLETTFTVHVYPLR